MMLFVVFILVGLILGAGAMLAPALPSREVRIAASGVFSLALVVSGAVFYGALFGWDTLVVDYLWFALIIGIFLGGTLTLGMHRAEAAGETDISWPGLRFLGVFALLLVILFLIFYQADLAAILHSDPRLFEKARLLERQNDLDALDRFPANNAPGMPVLLAYLDRQLPANLQDILRALRAALSLVIVWLVYDLARETGLGQRLAWVGVMVTAVGSMALRFDPAALLSANFVLGFGLFALRYNRHARRFEGFAAAVCATAALVTWPATLPWMAGAYLVGGLLLAYAPAENESPRGLARQWVAGLIVIGVLTIIGAAPWLASL